MPSTLAHSGLKAASVRVGQTLCTSNARKAAVFVVSFLAFGFCFAPLPIMAGRGGGVGGAFEGLANFN